ncbi:MAG: dihydropteroate synthase [Polyangiaceae bacterium]|nr:dihydropteroate synthase [Polyangiaceae bacterium]
MGILNVTPDSFYDGGTYGDEERARARLDELVRDGADIVDLGAESTRPGAPEVDAREQLARLGSLVGRAVAAAPCVSVDTTLPEVAERVLRAGAHMVNSVSLEPAAELGRLCARHGATLVLTHCRGRMSAMAGFSACAEDAYGDVVADVRREWEAAAARALGAGLAPSALVMDPGLGFTKSAAHSLELCARLDELVGMGYPILVGPSRKSFLAKVVADEAGIAAPAAADRLGASLAAALLCAARGARILRIHDVAATRQALAYARALAKVRRPAAAETGGPADA